MTFDELNELINKKFGTSKLSDIARELDVTPQVVSNWKSRNQVPYKYVKLLRHKISLIEKQNNSIGIEDVIKSGMSNYELENSGLSDLGILDAAQIILTFYEKIKLKKFIVLTSIIVLATISIFYYSSTDPEYVTKFTILPVGAESNSMMSLAASVGVKGITEKSTDGLFSSDLFPDIIRSRKLAKNLLGKELQISAYEKPQKLLNIKVKKPDLSDSLFTPMQKQVATTKILKMFSSRKLEKLSNFYNSCKYQV